MSITAATQERPISATHQQQLTRLVQAEYAEMPGLSITLVQAQRLWDVDQETCRLVFDRLIARGILRRTKQGRYIRAAN